MATASSMNEMPSLNSSHFVFYVLVVYLKMISVIQTLFYQMAG